MERKTRKHLEHELSGINGMTKQKYELGHSSSGYRLYNERMGVEITPYGLTAREMFFVLNAIKHTLTEEKKS
jgi:hypothetical protein